MKKLFKILWVTLLALVIFSLGGLTISQYANKIEFKNPAQVLKPLIQQLPELPRQEPSLPTLKKPNTPTIELTKPGVELTKPTLPTIKETSPSQEDPAQSAPIETEKTVTVTRDELNQLVSKIKVAKEYNKDYDRLNFERPTQSYELNGKRVNRREYAIFTSPFLISENPFVFECPYTGITIKDMKFLDYDHIIPCAYVSSRVDWSKEEMNTYSYAQAVGVPVQNKANRSKGSRGPSKWLPDVNRADYTYTWLLIASEWDIPLDQEDIDVCYLECINVIDSGHNLERID